MNLPFALKTVMAFQKTLHRHSTCIGKPLNKDMNLLNITLAYVMKTVGA